MKIDVTIEELEYMYGLVDRELTMSDAMYGFASGTRKERALMKIMHAKLGKKVQAKLDKMLQNQKVPMDKK